MDGVLFLSSKIHHQAFHEALVAEPVEVLNYRELAGLRTDFAIKKDFRSNWNSFVPRETGKTRVSEATMCI